MPIRHLLQISASKEIQRYSANVDREELFSRFVSFSGAPRQHPFDPTKILLVTDPFSSHTSFYEFESDDIAYAEELNALVTPEGETVNMVRLWIKKGSVGLHCTPFLVEDTRR